MKESIRHEAWRKDYKPLERSGVYNFSSSSHLRIPSFGRTDVGWGDVSIYTLSLYILLLLLVLAILLLFRLFYSTSLLFIPHHPEK